MARTADAADSPTTQDRIMTTTPRVSTHRESPLAMDDLNEALAAWGSHDRDDPFPLFARLREQAPVHAVTLADGHEAWLVLGYDEARAALNDTRFSKDMQAAFASGREVVAEGLPGPAFARHMLAVDQPDHTRLRRLVSGAFSAARTDGLRAHVQAIVDDLLDVVADQDPAGPVDLVVSLAFPMPFTVICELLGVPNAQREPLGRGLSTLLTPTATPEEFVRAQRASDEVVEMLRLLVETKRKTPGDDLVSGLIDARDGDERLDEPEMLSTIFQLIVAGHDTTASLIGNAMVALLTHPAELDRLRADPGSIAAAIEELMRYDAPVPHATFRYAREPVEISGVTIPAGAQVIINLAAANRDPRQNPNPDTLDITRSDAHHLGFGYGIHFCLGARLARMESQIALETLVRRFPALRLAVPGGALHWGHGDGLVLRGLTELPVIPGPARPRAH
jgi:cytochrome P450